VLSQGAQVEATDNIALPGLALPGLAWSCLACREQWLQACRWWWCPALWDCRQKSSRSRNRERQETAQLEVRREGGVPLRVTTSCARVVCSCAQHCQAHGQMVSMPEPQDRQAATPKKGLPWSAAVLPAHHAL
jgi:hypothetical protein